jgi:pimeloyl-ACP methyl ester carboxylesterase
MGTQRAYCSWPHGQLHYRKAGGVGGPRVLLLHQSPLSSVQFNAVIPLLAARGFDIAALDMPGFGQSDPLPEPRTLEGFASCVDAIFGALGWKRASIVGHHTGAVVAALFSVKSPQRVERLILNGFPLLTDAERAHFASFYFGPPEVKQDGSHLVKSWNNRLRSTPGWTDLALMNRYTVEGLYSSQTNWMAFPLIMKADLAGLLKEISVPTLLLTNTGEDLYEATRRARALRPDFFQYAELAGGTHDIIDEQPDNWTAAVARFLVG